MGITLHIVSAAHGLIIAPAFRVCLHTSIDASNFIRVSSITIPVINYKSNRLMKIESEIREMGERRGKVDHTLIGDSL